jgi:Na+/proline symporter
MIDYGEVVGDGFAIGFGMLWGAVTANPWVALLFAGIIVGALWLQFAPTRRRRR